MRIRAKQLALSMIAAHAAQVQAAPSPTGPVLITADRVWTGEGAPHQGWAVLVSKGRIEAVGRPTS